MHFKGELNEEGKREREIQVQVEDWFEIIVLLNRIAYPMVKLLDVLYEKVKHISRWTFLWWREQDPRFSESDSDYDSEDEVDDIDAEGEDPDADDGTYALVLHQGREYRVGWP